MRIQDAERVSKAVQTLRGRRSLDALVDRLFDITEGSLALDRATLHRIARGQTRVARAIDTPQDCVRLYFALMIVGARRTCRSRWCKAFPARPPSRSRRIRPGALADSHGLPARGRPRN